MAVIASASDIPLLYTYSVPMFSWSSLPRTFSLSSVSAGFEQLPSSSVASSSAMVPAAFMQGAANPASSITAV